MAACRAGYDHRLSHQECKVECLSGSKSALGLPISLAECIAAKFTGILLCGARTLFLHV